MVPSRSSVRTTPLSSKRVMLRFGDDRLCGVKLAFHDDHETSAAPEPDHLKLDFEFIIPSDGSTPFRGIASPALVSDNDSMFASPNPYRLPATFNAVPSTPLSGGESCSKNAEKCLMVTPDLSVLDQQSGSGLRKKTPRRHSAMFCPDTPSVQHSHRRRLSISDTCPDTPISMHSSQQTIVWSACALDTLREFTLTVPDMRRDFCDVECIGKGSFFDVFRATCVADGMVYALKCSRKPFRGKADRECYMREVKALKILPRHDHIIQYFRAWQENAHLVVQIEHCVASLGDLLISIVGADRPFDTGFVADCVFQIALGLAHCHDHGVIHLDIKLENILVTCESVLKIADFGQCQLPRNQFETDLDPAEGDCRYVPPEFLQYPQEGAMASRCPSADIFALGLVAFELITQVELPASGEQWQMLRNGADPVRYLQKHGCPPRLAAMVQAMLDPIPDRRPSAFQICQDVALERSPYAYPDLRTLLQEHSNLTAEAAS